MMNTKSRILLIAALLATVLISGKICQHLGFGQARQHDNPPEAKKDEVEVPPKPVPKTVSNSVNDSLYRWDGQLLDWILVEELPEYEVQYVVNSEVEYPTEGPIEIEWELLMDINYKLRYFSELDMEIYAPVFPENIQAFDGKEVLIEGFVIPFDEEQGLLSLSANPYASCFFCGQASPASVMSMYLKNERKRYKVDDFKTFKGTLHLNHDDPNEFYYILRNAEEE